MMVFTLIIGILYLGILGWIFWGSLQIKEFFLEEDASEKTKFSIIIPFRNEVKNLPELLDSLLKLNYPSEQFEVIFVDDESEDDSVELVENNSTSKFQYSILKNVRNSNSPKKDAITLAVSKAKYDWIVTTDADCVLPTNWLEVFHSFIIKKQSLFIAAPVGLNTQKSLITYYQLFDLLSLQTVTIGSFGAKSPLLCNGANLCYKKSVFKDVDGYKGNNHIASGDDIFLLEKIKKMFPNKIHYLKAKEVIVKTKTEKNWFQLIVQRIRWASKTSTQENVLSKIIGLVVFSCNLLVILGLSIGFINTNYLSLFLVFWMVKLLVDYLFIIHTASFFGSKIPFYKFIISSLLYSIITIIVVIGSLFGSYSWKGRVFKK